MAQITLLPEQLRADIHIDEFQLQQLTHLSLSNIRRRRARGQPPAFVKLGRNVRYPIRRVREWLASELVNAGAEKSA